MTLLKVPPVVSFITEPRITFAAKSLISNKTVGTFKASQIRISRKWADPDELEIELTCSTSWALAYLPTRTGHSGQARYAQVASPTGLQRIFLITEVDLSEIDAEHSKVSIKGMGPEQWLRMVPSSISAADSYTYGGSGTQSEILKTIMSMSSVDGPEEIKNTEQWNGWMFRSLPILDLMTSKGGTVTVTGPVPSAPVMEEYGSHSGVFMDTSREDGKETQPLTEEQKKLSWPAPVGDDFFSLQKAVPYVLNAVVDSNTGEKSYQCETRSEYELKLVPVSSPYDDGCLWWRWCWHHRDDSLPAIYLSRQSGTLSDSALHMQQKTEGLVYPADTEEEEKDSTGENTAKKTITHRSEARFGDRPQSIGPWTNVTVSALDKMWGSNKNEMESQARMLSGSSAAPVTIDVTADVESDKIDIARLRPGSKCQVRLGNQTFTWYASEVDYAYTSAGGWTASVPISIAEQKLDYDYDEHRKITEEPAEATIDGVWGDPTSRKALVKAKGKWYVFTASSSDETMQTGTAKAIALPDLPSSVSVIDWPWEKATGQFVCEDRLNTGKKDFYAVLWDDNIDPKVTKMSLPGGKKILSGTKSSLGFFTVVDETGIEWNVKLDENFDLLYEEAFPSATLKARGFYKSMPHINRAEQRGNAKIIENGSSVWYYGLNDLKSLDKQDGEKLLDWDEDHAGRFLTNQRLISDGKTIDPPSGEKLTHLWSIWLWSGQDSIVSSASGGLYYMDGSARTLTKIAEHAGEWRGLVACGFNDRCALVWGSQGLYLLTGSASSPTVKAIITDPIKELKGWGNKQLIDQYIQKGYRVCALKEDGTVWIVKTDVSSMDPTITKIDTSFNPTMMESRYPVNMERTDFSGNPLYSPLQGTIIIADPSHASLLKDEGEKGYSEKSIPIKGTVKQILMTDTGPSCYIWTDASIYNEDGLDLLSEQTDVAIKDVRCIGTSQWGGDCSIGTTHGAYLLWQATRLHKTDGTEDTKNRKHGLYKLKWGYDEIDFTSWGLQVGLEDLYVGGNVYKTQLAPYKKGTDYVDVVAFRGNRNLAFLMADGSVQILMGDDSNKDGGLYEVKGPGVKYDTIDKGGFGLIAYKIGEKSVSWINFGPDHANNPLPYPINVEAKDIDLGSPLKAYTNGIMTTDAGTVCTVDSNGNLNRAETAGISADLAAKVASNHVLMQNGNQWYVSADIKQTDGSWKWTSFITNISGDFVSISGSMLTTSVAVYDISQPLLTWKADLGSYDHDWTQWQTVIESSYMTAGNGNTYNAWKAGEKGYKHLKQKQNTRPTDQTAYYTNGWTITDLQTDFTVKTGRQLAVESIMLEFTDGTIYSTWKVDHNIQAEFKPGELTQTDTIPYIKGGSMEYQEVICIRDGVYIADAKSNHIRALNSSTGIQWITPSSLATSYGIGDQNCILYGDGEGVWMVRAANSSTPLYGITSASMDSASLVEQKIGLYRNERCFMEAWANVYGTTARPYVWYPNEDLGKAKSLATLIGTKSSFRVGWYENGITVFTRLGGPSITIQKGHFTPVAGWEASSSIWFTRDEDHELFVLIAKPDATLSVYEQEVQDRFIFHDTGLKVAVCSGKWYDYRNVQWMGIYLPEGVLVSMDDGTWLVDYGYESKTSTADPSLKKVRIADPSIWISRKVVSSQDQNESYYCLLHPGGKVEAVKIDEDTTAADGIKITRSPILETGKDLTSGGGIICEIGTMLGGPLLYGPSTIVRVEGKKRITTSTDTYEITYEDVSSVFN